VRRPLVPRCADPRRGRPRVGWPGVEGGQAVSAEPNLGFAVPLFGTPAPGGSIGNLGCRIDSRDVRRRLRILQKRGAPARRRGSPLEILGQTDARDRGDPASRRRSCSPSRRVGGVERGRHLSATHVRNRRHNNDFLLTHPCFVAPLLLRLCGRTSTFVVLIRGSAPHRGCSRNQSS